jgi:hypothetical protein
MIRARPYHTLIAACVIAWSVVIGIVLIRTSFPPRPPEPLIVVTPRNWHIKTVVDARFFCHPQSDFCRDI